jgi:hypothetical protein
MTPYLTDPNPPLSAKIRASYPGIAHFAGTGPEQQTCRACIFWDGCGDPVGYSAKWGTLNPRRCAKYKSLPTPRWRKAMAWPKRGEGCEGSAGAGLYRSLNGVFPSMAISSRNRVLRRAWTVLV